MADGVNQLIPELIGEAFIDAVRNSRHRAARRVRALWDRLRRVAGAPPGVELVAPDGAQYTGIVALDRSRAVLLIAIRHTGPGEGRDGSFRASEYYMRADGFGYREVEDVFE